MAFQSDSYNDMSQIKKSRPSLVGKLWQRTALRLLFAGFSIAFLAVQQPSWWLPFTDTPVPATKPKLEYSGKVVMTSLRGKPWPASADRDKAITDFVQRFMERQEQDLTELPRLLALKFQFHKANVRRVTAREQGQYDLRLTVSHYQPIAKIFGTPLILSRDGAIYESKDSQTLDLPQIRMTLAQKWTQRRTLDVTAKQQQSIDEAIALMSKLRAKGIAFQQLNLMPHRGFQVRTTAGLLLQFGRKNFVDSIKRYQKILKREDFSIDDVKEIHLDFKGKALITMKPKAN